MRLPRAASRPFQTAWCWPTFRLRIRGHDALVLRPRAARATSRDPSGHASSTKTISQESASPSRTDVSRRCRSQSASRVR